MQPSDPTAAAGWIRNVLYAAAAYNLAWGAAVIIAPLALFRWAGMADPEYPQIWQCVGMIVGVYGIGYWLAARDPFRHWPIVLVGFLGKILGPVGFLDAALTGSLPWSWGITIVFNDLIWWIPFASILYFAFRHNTHTSLGVPPVKFADAIKQIRSHRNASLLDISSAAPTLVVFLRHSGCTFCRETLAQLEQHQAQFEASGANLAIIHMGSPMDGTLMLQHRNLRNTHYFSDPNCVLYRAFEIPRGTLWQLFSASVIAAGVRALLNGHGLGTLSGDGFRMPGTFLLKNGQIVAEHRARSAADHPDYLSLMASAGGKMTHLMEPESEAVGLAISGL